MEHKTRGRKSGYKNGTPDIDRFLALVEYDENGCLIWQGASHGSKALYAGFFTNHPVKKHAAHRWILKYTLGEDFDESLQALHKCDVPRCVNPEHLYLGTPLQNVKDMDDRGRRRSAQGEKTATAKMTEEQVREIRAAYTAGTTSKFTGERVDVSFRTLGEKYGLAASTVYALVRGKNWKHVDPLSFVDFERTRKENL